jgi:hypothetical protein
VAPDAHRCRRRRPRRARVRARASASCRTRRPPITSVTSSVRKCGAERWLE